MLYYTSLLVNGDEMVFFRNHLDAFRFYRKNRDYKPYFTGAKSFSRADVIPWEPREILFNCLRSRSGGPDSMTVKASGKTWVLYYYNRFQGVFSELQETLDTAMTVFSEGAKPYMERARTPRVREDFDATRVINNLCVYSITPGDPPVLGYMKWDDHMEFLARLMMMAGVDL